MVCRKLYKRRINVWELGMAFSFCVKYLNRWKQSGLFFRQRFLSTISAQRKAGYFLVYSKQYSDRRNNNSRLLIWCLTELFEDFYSSHPYLDVELFPHLESWTWALLSPWGDSLEGLPTPSLGCSDAWLWEAKYSRATTISLIIGRNIGCSWRHIAAIAIAWCRQRSG